MNRYQKARAEWDERIGSARVQAYNWRRIALLQGVALLLVIGGMIAQSLRAEVTPYVVEVTEVGQVRLVGTPNEERFEPTEAMVTHVLERFVQSARQTTDDAEVMRAWWREATGYLSAEGHERLKDWMREERSEARPAGCRVTPVASHVLSDTTHRLEWIERCEHERPQRYVGLFEIEIAAATDVASLKRNPLGVWITHFSWSASSGPAGKGRP